MKLIINLLLIITILLSYVVVSSAQTPDGVTPAEENVCDILLKTNENVWGICNAFCEAKDCDSQKIFDKSCSQLLKNFVKNSSNKTPMPCLPDNFCTDFLGNYYINPVKDCEEIKTEEECNNSFQPYKDCRVYGDDTVGCVWDYKNGSCINGYKVTAKYCCTDSFELTPEPIELRTSRDAYNY
jgi:hypothetical protein